MLSANYQNAVAGVYNSGNILVTINWTGGSSGSSTAVVTAGGTVINICKPNTPGALNFFINPSITGIVSTTLSPDLQIQCTMGDNVSVNAVSTCGGKMYSSFPACSGNNIPYTFTCMGNTGACFGITTGNGFGVPGTALGIGGSVISANYENAPVGNYGDLQTLTITY